MPVSSITAPTAAISMKTPKATMLAARATATHITVSTTPICREFVILKLLSLILCERTMLFLMPIRRGGFNIGPLPAFVCILSADEPRKPKQVLHLGLNYL